MVADVDLADGVSFLAEDPPLATAKLHGDSTNSSTTAADNEGA